MKNSKFLPIIGLEVHIELKTESKMFCGCSAPHFQVKPNTHTCPVCLGLPGALPVPNQKAINWCLLAGLALGCQVPNLSKFDRKNYFYPDLPKGYQISQYDLPFAINGKLNVKGQRPARQPSQARRPGLKVKCIRIRRVHLEEDTAKLIHKEGSTLIDFNRSGVPLMEIVSEPDISSPAEAKVYLKKLQQIIRYLEISDCDMEKGSMRLEANVSLQEFPISPGLAFGMPRAGNFQFPKYKVEIKNLNSFRFVQKALGYEIDRQKELLSAGKKLSQETRGWDEVKQVTFPQRVKESAADYRYFPEPDIPPIRWEKKAIEQLRNSLPELPDERIKRYVNQFKINEKDAHLLARLKETAEYFESAIKQEKLNPAETASLIINKRVDIQKTSPQQLVNYLQAKRKAVISDTPKLTQIIQAVIQENSKAVSDLQKGKQAAIGYLIGQVMRKTQRKADPQITKRIILEKLKQPT